MFLKIEDTAFRDRIYRDGRMFFYPILAFFTFFIWVAIMEYEVNPSFTKVTVPMSLLSVTFFGFLIRWALHGSIVLDESNNLLTFSESWTLQKPGLTVPKRNIDRIKMRYMGGGGVKYGGTSGGYQLILGIAENRHYKEKILSLLFLKYDDCKKAARLIGKFANKPAYDHNEDQIFEPKE